MIVARFFHKKDVSGLEGNLNVLQQLCILNWICSVRLTRSTGWLVQTNSTRLQSVNLSFTENENR